MSKLLRREKENFYTVDKLTLHTKSLWFMGATCDDLNCHNK